MRRFVSGALRLFVVAVPIGMTLATSIVSRGSNTVYACGSGTIAFRSPHGNTSQDPPGACRQGDYYAERLRCFVARHYAPAGSRDLRRAQQSSAYAEWERHVLWSSKPRLLSLWAAPVPGIGWRRAAETAVEVLLSLGPRMDTR